MKTYHSHLLACALLILTCIQPAKAMEKDSPQRNWRNIALIGSGAALAAGTLGTIIWAYRHQPLAPEIQEPSEILAIRAHLAQLKTLSVHHDEPCPKFDIQFTQLKTVLNFNPDDQDPDWLQKHPILTAATVLRKYFDLMGKLKKQDVSVFALRKQVSSLMSSFVTSQEILNEARDTGNYYE